MLIFVTFFCGRAHSWRTTSPPPSCPPCYCVLACSDTVPLDLLYLRYSYFLIWKMVNHHTHHVQVSRPFPRLTFHLWCVVCFLFWGKKHVCTYQLVAHIAFHFFFLSAQERKKENKTRSLGPIFFFFFYIIFFVLFCAFIRMAGIVRGSVGGACINNHSWCYRK